MADAAPPSLARCAIPAAILVLAAILRLHDLAAQSIWFDEAATIRIVNQDWATMFDTIRTGERIPPLHYVLLHAWVRVFGDSDFSVRLPSAIASVAAVWAVYKLGAYVLGWAEGCIAALLMATSSFHIAYAQETRAYALLALLSVLSCYWFARLLHGDSDARRARRIELAYVVTTALLLYCHLYGVFAIAAQHLAYTVALVSRRKPAIFVRRWAMLNVAVLALFSPWVPVVVRWVRSVHTDFWVLPMTLDAVSDAFRQYTGSAALVAVLAALLVVGVARTRDDPRTLALLLGLMLPPVVVPVVLSILARPTFTPRYAIAAVAGLYLLAARGIMALRPAWVRALVTSVALVLSVIGRDGGMEKADWRGAVAHVERRADADDIVVITPRLTTYPYDHYATRTNLRRKGFDTWSIPLGLPLEEGVRVWLIYPPHDMAMNAILARGNWRVVSRRGFKELQVVELDDGP
jgi:mannosyltransferase